jgi:hypothetical protein
MDIFNLPNNDINNSVFYSIGSGNSWQTWNKPKNTEFIYINAIGGGGGGGSSPNTGISTVRGGGGGGGCSSISSGLFPACVLPDTLYIQVGTGGLGGTLGTAGANGTISYVSVQPNTTSTNVILANGNSGGGGGGAGTSSAGGTAGSAGTVLTQTNCGLSYLGIINFNVGQVGLAGSIGNGVAGGSTTLASFILPLTGGAGGGGVNSSNVIGLGGTITGGFLWPTISSGSSGYQSIIASTNTSKSTPMFFMGGSGGSGSSASAGGNGGNGAYGCGGGGAGGGITPGNGGNGGNGLIIITCF